MSATPPQPPASDEDDFRREAQRSENDGFLADFRDFLFHNKKWWLTPIILALLLVGLLVLLSSSVVAPFIYPLF